MGSERSDFRVLFVEWCCFHRQTYDPPLPPYTVLGCECFSWNCLGFYLELDRGGGFFRFLLRVGGFFTGRCMPPPTLFLNGCFSSPFIEWSFRFVYPGYYFIRKSIFLYVHDSVFLTEGDLGGGFLTSLVPSGSCGTLVCSSLSWFSGSLVSSLGLCPRTSGRTRWCGGTCS